MMHHGWTHRMPHRLIDYATFAWAFAVHNHAVRITMLQSKGLVGKQWNNCCNFVASRNLTPVMPVISRTVIGFLGACLGNSLLEFNKFDIIQEEPFDVVLVQDTYGYLIAASVMGGKKAMFSVWWELNSSDVLSLRKGKALQFQAVRWRNFIHCRDCSVQQLLLFF